MSEELTPSSKSPFERIRRIDETGGESWSSREFAKILGYSDYRNFEKVIENAKTACQNSGQKLDDHFVEVTDMVDIGSSAKRPVQTVYMSRYACYLAIQNADPSKEIVAAGKTYFVPRKKLEGGK
jgi:DNA-damage-inducible protein D